MGRMAATERVRQIARAKGNVAAATAMVAGRSTGDPALPLLATALETILALLDDSEPATAKALARAQDAGREAGKR